MDLRSVSAEQRATLTRIRSLLKRAETWPMRGDDNLRQWIDEMRYLVPLLLDRIAAAEAETARLRAALKPFASVAQVYKRHPDDYVLLDVIVDDRSISILTLGQVRAATLSRTEEQATPETACFCCQQSCQEGCSCYEHSPDKIKDDEYMAQLEVRMAAVGMPAGTLYVVSNAYGLYSKATELWYPETDEQRQACLRDGRPVAARTEEPNA